MVTQTKKLHGVIVQLKVLGLAPFRKLVVKGTAFQGNGLATAHTVEVVIMARRIGNDMVHRFPGGREAFLNQAVTVEGLEAPINRCQANPKPLSLEFPV
jgi:hypothetical protein